MIYFVYLFIYLFINSDTEFNTSITQIQGSQLLYRDRMLFKDVY